MYFERLALVADLAQKIAPPGDVVGSFNSLWQSTIDYAKYPRPCSVWITMISTGFAVAQKIEQTSGTLRMAVITLIGYAVVSTSTNVCPQPRAWAFLIAIS
jgi:hypothetical protein